MEVTLSACKSNALARNALKEIKETSLKFNRKAFIRNKNWFSWEIYAAYVWQNISTMIKGWFDDKSTLPMILQEYPYNGQIAIDKTMSHRSINSYNG